MDDTKAKWRKNRWCAGRRLTPYITNITERGKYERTGYNHDHANTGFGMRTGVNNANRSKKKGLRQKFKKEIKIAIQEIY